MKITKMKAKWGKNEYEIFVSPMMKNDTCDDDFPRYGWWYCCVGGTVGTFVTKRPKSGRQLNTLAEYDIFNTMEPINTKEEFAEYLKD